MTGSIRARACCCCTSCAWPRRAGGATAQSGSPSCTSTRRTATTTPRTGSSAGRTTDPTRTAPACSTGPTIRGCEHEERLYGFPLDWLVPDAVAAAARGGPAAGRRDDRPARRRGHRREPGVSRARAQRLDPHRRAALPGLDRRVCRSLARAGGRERRSDPGQCRAGRRGRQPARRPLVWRALRLELAARLVQRRPGGRRRRAGGRRRDRRSVVPRPRAASARHASSARAW